ncbi:NAD(P)-dependent oxidoreductase [Marinococcus sp. PL1-022]|uniref:NAD(P)-dependent oxidoreductase n=1 Tax=Marinococcus sp. PL1-022 TaxID=3095363 RepID=UPI0029C5DED9|nr:NAD(P)H-binding protein [Marinococcus sp. PL1-022]MDX6151669.1 NAD(P)H-binding protein [Marinococcus sp. PL1-022]
MKIVVFGATGNTGKRFVRKALKEGSEVVVYARQPEKLLIDNENLTVHEGKITNYQNVYDSLKGADAVVSLLGRKEAAKGTPLSTGMSHIVNAMQERNISRLVAVTSSDVKIPKDGASKRFSLLTAGWKVAKFKGSNENANAADIIRQSNLDWTLVRVPVLSDKPSGENAPTVGYPGRHDLKNTLYRQTLVDFLYEQLETSDFSREAPVLSN